MVWFKHIEYSLPNSLNTHLDGKRFCLQFEKCLFLELHSERERERAKTSAIFAEFNTVQCGMNAARKSMCIQKVKERLGRRML